MAEPLNAETSEAITKLRTRQCARAAQAVVAEKRTIKLGTLDDSDMGPNA